ncbi:hypothetical protein D3C84_656070 [compost metagenome]
MGLPQTVDHTFRRVIVARQHQALLTGPDTLQACQLNATGRHGVQQELELGQLIEKRLVVERHFDVLLGAETAHRAFLDARPGGLDNQLGGQCATGAQAIGQGLKALQRELPALLRVLALNLSRQAEEESGKGFTLGDRPGIRMSQRVEDFSVVIRVPVVHFTHDIRDRQNPRLAPRQHVIGVTDFLPLEGRILRHHLIPVTYQVGALYGIERRQVLVHVIEHTLLGVLGRIVFADLLVPPEVADAVGLRQVHHAVAVAQAVIGIGLHECHGCAQGVVHMEVIVGGEHHERRGHLLHAKGQLGANAPVAKLRDMLVIHIFKLPGQAWLTFSRRIQHQNPARQAAVETCGPAQKCRPLVRHQHHGQLFVECQPVFRIVLALHTFPHNGESPKKPNDVLSITARDADSHPARR